MNPSYFSIESISKSNAQLTTEFKLSDDRAIAGKKTCAME